ncbi:hypothetical protein MBLNU457_3082t1 [Dothideomycetes sp. NU457]
MRAFTAIAAASSLLVSVATAQYTINPDSVPLSTRQVWCNSQITQCPLICLQTAGNTLQTQVNDCNATVLSYDCVCTNGQSPNASEYSQTLPYFVCTQWGDQCVANCGNDNTCASACRANHPCGALHPTTRNITSTSSSASATGSGSGSKTTGAGVPSGSVFNANAASTTAGGSGAPTGSVASSSNKSAANLALQVGQAYGLMVVAGGLMAGFALAL